MFSDRAITNTTHLGEAKSLFKFRLRGVVCSTALAAENGFRGRYIRWHHRTRRACNGTLHLAYFATEITLHRCIVRSLNAETADHHLSHIVDPRRRLALSRPWSLSTNPSTGPSEVLLARSVADQFALIGSFGTLLLATAPTKEEAEFYRMRLGEYRWTLGMSVKNAEHLKFALDSLDLALQLAENIPEKPGIEALMASLPASKKQHTTAATTSLRRRYSDPTMMTILNDLPRRGMDEVMGTGSSSVISGLASPVTSIVPVTRKKNFKLPFHQYLPVHFILYRLLSIFFGSLLHLSLSLSSLSSRKFFTPRWLTHPVINTPRINETYDRHEIQD